MGGKKAPEKMRQSSHLRRKTEKIKTDQLSKPSSNWKYWSNKHTSNTQMVKIHNRKHEGPEAEKKKEPRLLVKREMDVVNTPGK